MTDLNATQTAKLFAHVRKTDGCWEWTASVTAGGYGQMRVGTKVKYAHRLFFQQLVGDIPDGMKLDHKCSNRRCVRPDHLRVVTNKQNAEHLVPHRSNNTSGYRGVSWHAASHAWMAQVSHQGKKHYLGCFPSAALAGQAALEKRIELFTHNDLDRLIDGHELAAA